MSSISFNRLARVADTCTAMDQEETYERRFKRTLDVCRKLEGKKIAGKQRQVVADAVTIIDKWLGEAPSSIESEFSYFADMSRTVSRCATSSDHVVTTRGATAMASSMSTMRSNMGELSARLQELYTAADNISHTIQQNTGYDI